jgi:DNA-binding NarL/FixJ family response regulator
MRRASIHGVALLAATCKLVGDMTVRVLVVDDRAMPRIAAKAMLDAALDISHIGEAVSGSEALEVAPRLKPDLVLMDVDMPGMNGAEAARRLISTLPQIKILAWTVSDSSDDLLRMMQAGCVGYVLKDVGPEELHRAIRVAIRNEVPVPRRMVPEVLRRAADQAPNNFIGKVALTGREHETLRWLAKGSPAKRIATEMGISVASVDTHLRNLYRKLEVNNRGEALNVALKLGLLKLHDL